MEIGQPAWGSGFRASVIAATAVLLGVAPQSEARPRGLSNVVGPYQLEVLVGGNAAPTFSHGGDTYVLGQPGERYTVRVWNRTPVRVEAVVTVDGRDVVDGKPGDFRKRGYLVNAGGFVDIDGWRLSQRQVAAFRFTSVASSYAARTGDARNVGVIGVAVFPERIQARPPLQLVAPHHEKRAEGSSGFERAPGAPSAAPAQRPGLGTEFGESVSSQIREVQFVRTSPMVPAVVLGVRYNDRRGLLAVGIDVDGPYQEAYDAWLRGSADPFPVSQPPYARPPTGWRR